MSEVFLLKNQHGAYLERSGEWVDPMQSKTLFRTPHRDEAINQKVELAVKNAELRVEIAAAKVSPEGKLLIQDYVAPLEMPATSSMAESTDGTASSEPEVQSTSQTASEDCSRSDDNPTHKLFGAALPEESASAQPEHQSEPNQEHETLQAHSEQTENAREQSSLFTV